MPMTALPQEHLDAMVAEVRRLRDALEDLLDDTQHSEHDCGDTDCPVARAHAVLRGESES
jgi:hypothetical protein